MGKVSIHRRFGFDVARNRLRHYAMFNGHCYPLKIADVFRYVVEGDK